jgi:DNA modification methylase
MAVEDSLFTVFLKEALPFCVEREPVYQWHASRRQGVVEAGWLANELLVHQTIIWVKARAVLTRNHFMFQFEPCFYGWPVGKMPTKRRRPPCNMSNVWQVDQKGQSDGIHPTQKPVELFRRVMEWSTLPGEICLEPFSGSGTQIMAAEELHRRCYAIEISPAFVDVAVVRWQNATKNEARLVDEKGQLGPTFAEVGKTRTK